MSISTRIVRLGLFVVSLLLCAATAQAVTIDFTGRVFGDNSLNARGLWFGQGFDVTGSYSYDSTLVPTLNSSTINTFLSNNAGNAGLNWSMTFTVGASSRTITESDGLFNFGLFDRPTSTLGDLYSFTGAGNKASIVLRDPGVGADAVPALNGTVPTSAPNLSLFGGLNQGIYNVEPFFVNFLKFDIITISDPPPPSAPIPEPGTLLLLGSGLAGLAFFRWRRKAA